MTPRDLENNIGPDQVITSVEHANVAFAAANIDKLRRFVSMGSLKSEVLEQLT